MPAKAIGGLSSESQYTAKAYAYAGKSLLINHRWTRRGVSHELARAQVGDWIDRNHRNRHMQYSGAVMADHRSGGAGASGGR